jgi:predicted permease
LLSQLFTESVLLAVLGGVAGLLVAHWGGAILRAKLSFKSEAAAGIYDPRTVLFAFIAAVAVGLLTGLAPAFQSRRVDLTSDLKAGSREGTYGRSRARVALLVLQGALSVILLVGAGLFVRSLGRVQSVRLGYDVDPVMLVNLNMRGSKLDSAQTVDLRLRLLNAAKSVAGVKTASLQTSTPFWGTWSQSLFVEGIDTVGKLGQFDLNAVSPEFFATLGTRIIRGRGIRDDDTPRTPRVAVVSENMGKALWPGRDAIGQCFRIGRDTMPCTYVVGIAENIKEQSLSADSGFYYYLPWKQFNPTSGGLFVRANGDAARYAEAVRRRLQREMPGASYVTITPFSDIIGRVTESWQLGATMFVAFGMLALLLAAIGLYSVIAYNVAQRTHELGVRVALGARSPDVIRLVVTDGLKVAVVGVAIGALIALWAGRWVKPLLFGVSANDPFVFAVVSFTLIVVAVAASWIPALRASRVDPNVALRTD